VALATTQDGLVLSVGGEGVVSDWFTMVPNKEMEERNCGAESMMLGGGGCTSFIEASDDCGGGVTVESRIIESPSVSKEGNSAAQSALVVKGWGCEGILVVEGGRGMEEEEEEEEEKEEGSGRESGGDV